MPELHWHGPTRCVNLPIRNHRLVFVAEPKRLQEFFEKHGQAKMQKLPIFTFKKDPRG